MLKENIIVACSVSSISKEQIQKSVKALQEVCHGLARDSGWWTDLETGEEIVRNNGEAFMLMVSEISEAMEADRKKLMDDKLPHRNGVEVELADCVIRILDFSGGRGLDLGAAIAEKLLFNQNRPDHKVENRVLQGGKKY
jgi:hypothetical protein